MTALRIRDWGILYEVNEKGRAWKPGEQKRQRPLQYLRCRVNGASWSGGFREFLAAAGKSAAASFGVFVKALEIAADQTVERRGWLLGRNSEPLDTSSFARASGFNLKDVDCAFKVLQDPTVQWIERAELPKALRPVRESPGESGRIRDPSDKEGRVEEGRSRVEEQTGEKPTAQGAANPTPPYKDIEKQWNTVCGAAGLPRVVKISEARRVQIRTRWADPDFRDNFPELLTKGAASSFATGKDNGRPFFTFDWLFKNGTNYVKVLEGNYDNRKPRQDSDTQSGEAIALAQVGYGDGDLVPEPAEVA